MELWNDREVERLVKSSCNDPSPAQRIVPVTFLMIMKNLIQVNSIQNKAEYFQDDVDFYLAQYDMDATLNIITEERHQKINGFFTYVRLRPHDVTRISRGHISRSKIHEPINLYRLKCPSISSVVTPPHLPPGR